MKDELETNLASEEAAKLNETNTPVETPEVTAEAAVVESDNAEENAADTIVGGNFNEVQKHLACTNHILYANQISMNKKAYDSLDPAYQKALNQAVSQALKEMEPKLAEIEKKNLDTLKTKGMNIITYDKAFFDKVLAIPAVKELYKTIDGQVNGLGTTLVQELDKAGK